MEVMENREIFLPIAVEQLLREDFTEEERQEILQDLRNEFDAHFASFEMTLTSIRLSRHADQVEKILRIFQRKKLKAISKCHILIAC